MEKFVASFLRKLPFLRRNLDSHMFEVISGASIAFLMRSLGGGFAFCFSLLVAKKLGAEGIGTYYLALGVATVASVFGRMGLDTALLRFTAAHAAIRDWKSVKGAYDKGTGWTLASTCVATLAMFFASPFLAQAVFQKPELASPMRWMATALVPMSILALNAQALKGLKRIRDSIFIDGASVPFFSLLFFSLLPGTGGIQGATGAFILANVVTAFLSLLLWRSAFPGSNKSRGSFGTAEMLRSSSPLFWLTLLNLLTNWTSFFILGIWGTKEEVGIFGAAVRSSMLVGLVLYAVNSISAPKFAALHKKKQFKALASTAVDSAKLMTLLASPLLTLFLFFPGWVMGLFGPEFRAGSWALIILAAGQFVNVATGSVGPLLTMSGNEHLARNRAIFIAGLSLFLNLALIPLLGVLGAAIATAASVAWGNLISVYLVRSKLGIWTIPFLPAKARK